MPLSVIESGPAKMMDATGRPKVGVQRDKIPADVHEEPTRFATGTAPERVEDQTLPGPASSRTTGSVDAAVPLLTPRRVLAGQAQQRRRG